MSTVTTAPKAVSKGSSHSIVFVRHFESTAGSPRCSKGKLLPTQVFVELMACRLSVPSTRMGSRAVHPSHSDAVSESSSSVGSAYFYCANWRLLHNEQGIATIAPKIM